MSCSHLAIYGHTSALLNTLSVFKERLVSVETVAFAGCCAANAVLSPRQRREGALLIDIGGGTSDYVLVQGGDIVDAGCLPIGGGDITSEIAGTFNIPLKTAEYLKKRCGNAIANVADDAPLSMEYDPADLFRCRIRQAEFDTVIHVKLSEILFAIRSRLRRGPARQRFEGGVVLCGGGARLRNLPVLASQVYSAPAILASPAGVLGRLPVAAYEFAAVVGLLEEGLRPPSNPIKTWLEEVRCWFS